MNKKKVLIIDDEINIIELLKMNLKKHGYDVIYALNGEDGMPLAIEHKPDVILLDLMLPGIDGFEICRRIKMEKEIARIPIIMLTAKSEETDKVIGLGIGADDYITKPFGIRELIARINVALRKVEEYSQKDTPKVIKVKDLVINIENHLVEKNSQEINLTLSEFKILKKLTENQGRVITREELLNEIAPENSIVEARTLDVHMANLRKKVGEYEKGLSYVETIRGVGYKMP